MIAHNNDNDALTVDAINWLVGTQTMAAARNTPGIEDLRYHYPLGPGDHHYVDLHMQDGAVSRIFNPTQIVFKDPNYEAGGYDTERANGSEDHVSDEGDGGHSIDGQQD